MGLFLFVFPVRLYRPCFVFANPKIKPCKRLLCFGMYFHCCCRKLIVGLSRSVSVDYNCLSLGYRNFSVLFFENGFSITLLEKSFYLLCFIPDVIKYVIETQLNKLNPVDSPSEIFFCIFRERNQLKPICILKAITLKGYIAICIYDYVYYTITNYDILVNYLSI